MANTITVSNTVPGAKQFQGVFNNVLLVTGTIDDHEAVGAGTSEEFTITVPGAALGDMVIGITTTSTSVVGAASCHWTGIVHAADTVRIKMMNIDDVTNGYAADSLNGVVIKFIVARPSW